MMCEMQRQGVLMTVKAWIEPLADVWKRPWRLNLQA
jgi:hypothetical protein